MNFLNRSFGVLLFCRWHSSGKARIPPFLPRLMTFSHDSRLDIRYDDYPFNTFLYKTGENGRITGNLEDGIDGFFQHIRANPSMIEWTQYGHRIADSELQVR
jgi:hypothetical protein